MNDKETLEEVAEKTADNFEEPNFKAGVIYGVIDGAKWQAERMYSEEEVRYLLYLFLEHIGEKQKRTILNVIPKEWFEQFKK